MKVNLLDLDRAAMQGWFASIGENPFRARQVLRWIHQRGAQDFDAMTDIAKSLRTRLAEDAELRAPAIVGDSTSADGTRKWLLKVDRANAVDSVYIPETGRGTLCISSQAGCTLDCSFCSTGKQGFNRNLSTAEIVSQLWIANRLLGRKQGAARPITNVVLMGMGEPMLNLDEVLAAARRLPDVGITHRRTTISTVGWLPGLTRFVDEIDMPIRLALSLHAADGELRSQIMPVNDRFPLRAVVDECRRHFALTRRRVFVEYVMLAGVNDSRADARALASLLGHEGFKVNLIPYNPTGMYDGSDRDHIARFREELEHAHVPVTVRLTRGRDIEAACGQLAAAPKSRRVKRPTPRTA